MPPIVHIIAPSRLHFGMLSFGQPDVRQFGGAGVMIDRPGLELKISESSRLEAHGPLADRALAFARRICDALCLDRAPSCRFDIVSAPQEHSGLGVGTQLGLSVAAGLLAFLDRPEATPSELARLTGRARRSSVGTYGFCEGGLIVEAGRANTEEMSPLVCRVEVPSQWRFVLLCPTEHHSGSTGLSGAAERRAFAQLPPVPKEVTEALCRELLLELIPAAREARFDAFGASLYRYGHQAGSCFAACQGGPFASPQLQRLVETIRDLGVEGVGQTSWGPTLFALLPSQAEAAEFVRTLKQLPESRDLELLIAQADNRGARVQRGLSDRA